MLLNYTQDLKLFLHCIVTFLVILFCKNFYFDVGEHLVCVLTAVVLLIQQHAFDSDGCLKTS